MKKIISLILLISTLLTLFSCGGNDDGVPEGMQLVRGSDELGYYMYAPEEWTVANYADISTAYASNVDTSSISYVEVPMPEGTVDKYFADSLKEFPENQKPTVVFPAPKEDNPKEMEDNEIVFGNADTARKYVFDHEYSGHKFRTMQIFTEFKGRFGIFTFNSMLENVSSPDMVQYDYYKEKIDNVIKNFKFVPKPSDSEKETEYEADKDGYRLVSDKNTAKYLLYLPEEFSVEYSSGMTVAKLPDGSNITLCRASTTGIPVGEYWNIRKEELSAVVSDFKVISENETINFANARHAVAYKYTFVYNNTEYQAYQVFATSMWDGFAFTYTATKENFDKHFDTTISEVCKRIEF